MSASSPVGGGGGVMKPRCTSPSGRSDAGSVASSSLSSSKKNLSDLTKDELVNKCKSLLLLAQKAKSAKDGKTDDISPWIYVFRIPVFISDAVKQLHKVQVRAEEASTLQEMVETLNAQKTKFAEEIRSVKDNEASLRAQMEDMEQDNNRLESQCMELKRY